MPSSFRPALLSLLLLVSLPAGARNVLLLIADDFGIDSYGLTNATPGASLPPTPNLDSLKTTGVLFRNAHAQPICSSSRACLLTGRQPYRHGVTNAVSEDDGQLSANEFTLPRAFAANPALGVATACFGKWHLTLGPNPVNDPNTIGGWPHYAGCLTGALISSYTSWTKTVNGVSAPATTYATTDVANDTISWIQARGTQPWFAWVAFNAPHAPFHKPPNNLHSYDAVALPVTTANRRQFYEAAVEAMDTEIGRILAAVDRANTDIVFVGDNGTPGQVIQAPYTAPHAKDSLYEGGTRVPLIISGPSVVAPNRESPALVHIVDLYATILELAGVDVAATQPATRPLDARSLLPLLRNQTESPRLACIEESGSNIPAAEAGRALRNEAGYKLIQFQDGHEEAYFIPTDPNETANLLLSALSPTAQANLDALRADLATRISPANPLGTPLETSWQRLPGAKYARVYTTQARALAGQASTTWLPGGLVTGGGQATPVYAGVESVRVSADWVYAKGSALPGHVMGPWYFDLARTQIFVNLPSKWDLLARIPRHPVAAAIKSKTDLGPIAVWVNTTLIHNQLDAFIWNGTQDVSTADGVGSWQRNARMAEGLTFDPAGAHQPFTGESHHHINPMGLRHELGDHVDYDPASHTYSESNAAPRHSPILGWSFDGYPIYGPYGYSVANDPASPVRRMVSGYIPRDGAQGTTDLRVTGRTSYPQWAIDAGQVTSPNGPAVSTAYPLGWYLQDFDHLADRGFVQGGTFDVDRYNGRWCRTPDYPEGTYAYFVTIGADGAPAFPYIIGRQYYGVKTGGNFGAASTVGFTAVATPVETLFEGGAAASMNVSAVSTGGSVTLTWSATEGGRYAVESSPNLTTWQTVSSNLPASGPSMQAVQPDGGASRAYYQVRRDSLDPVDTVDTP